MLLNFILSQPIKVHRFSARWPEGGCLLHKQLFSPLKNYAKHLAAGKETKLASINRLATLDLSEEVTFLFAPITENIFREYLFASAPKTLGQEGIHWRTPPRTP